MKLQEPPRIAKRTQVLAIAAAAVLTLAVPSYEKKPRGKPREPVAVQYGKAVALGVGDLDYPLDTTTCIDLGALLTSGDFFDGLVRIGDTSGARFYKAAQPVETFPDTVMVTVRTGAYYCRTFPNALGGPFLNDDFMRALRFEASWARGLQEPRPAKCISTRAAKVGMTELGPEKWVYQVVIDSKHVPLSDDLILKVLSKEGQFLGRLRGGLDSPIALHFGTQKLRP